MCEGVVFDHVSCKNSLIDRLGYYTAKYIQCWEFLDTINTVFVTAVRC
ncbi:predicted protein [Botrytis cinerea T4]|uniref:Uncharacterized protein n=1 Tax=Botryotinia fuckeliana (strain T4) TaxID=999810 RepID=G2YXA4_BOTF4|nr:predicted protein [Botrytis cinerea T4]